MDNLYRNRALVEKCSPLAIMLSYAAAVILIFSIIFLFYINSFLIKRRKKELGIYNILGMGKGHLGKMLFLESVITTVASIIGGILAGILLSKLVYLILLKILHMGGKIEYRISLASTGLTTILFGAIFILIFLYNLLQMKLSNPIELLRGGNTGEREPKTKWIMTIIGILCLAGGYSIALITKEPLQALGQFFIAVLLVVVGTYALFMAGSITLLKILRRKKSYYYKTRHFTAVSGMIYRMKQNAVGLANICILSTMVLVMVSMTVSLYGGMNDVITTRFPYEAQITSSGINQKEEGQIEEIIKNMTKKNHTVPTSQIRFHIGRFTTVYNSKTKKFDMMAAGDYANSNAVDLVMIQLSVYYQTEGKNVKLKEKIRESLSAVLPITGIVLMLSIFVIPMELGSVVMFLTGALMLIVGMGFFQLGAEMAMTPLGEGVGVQNSIMKKLLTVLLTGFLMGVIITVSEPDLQVLAGQVPSVPNMVLIMTVAVGVGLFLALAIVRIRYKISLSMLLIVCYLALILVSAFVPKEFLAVAFDSGGVTTGPMTVPFIMAMGVGLASVRSDKNAANDSFGLVALSSVGPILAVLILGCFFKPTEAAYTLTDVATVVTTQDVARVFAQGLPLYAREVLLSLVPILWVFLIFQWLTHRYHGLQIKRIIVGYG